MPSTLQTLCPAAALLLPAPAASAAQSPRPIELAVDATDASRVFAQILAPRGRE